MQVFYKKHLLARLKEEGLPHAYKSLLKYERAGIIPLGKNDNTGMGIIDTWRTYSQEEIEDCVKKLREYLKDN